MRVRTCRRTIALTLLSALSLTACGSQHHLGEYAFPGHTLAVSYTGATTPELYTGSYNIREDDDAFLTIMKASAEVVKDASAHQAGVRLDSAAALTDFGALVTQRLAERAALSLGLRLVPAGAPADFVLEVQMRHVGIDARRSSGAALFSSADAVLLDHQSGREIWRARASGAERLSPVIRGAGGIPGNVVTAGTLSRASVEDFRGMLDRLASVSASSIVDKLRDDLRGVQ